MIRKRNKRTPQKVDVMERMSNLKVKKYQQINLENLLRSLRMNEFNDNISFACDQ